MVSHPEHAPLRPILLLLGWDRYPAVGSGKELLDTLWPLEVREVLQLDGATCPCVYVIGCSFNYIMQN